MNEKPANGSTTNEERMIRETFEGMDVPIDRERMKLAFMESVRQEFPQRRFRIFNGLAWLFTPRMGLAVSVSYAIVAFIYCLVGITGSPIREIDDKTPGWNLSFRAAQCQPLRYEKSNVLLNDGTRVNCMKPSMFSISYSPQERHIDLLKGTVEITAAPNKNRPLIVSVGDTRIKVTGTRFIVSVTESIK